MTDSLASQAKSEAELDILRRQLREANERLAEYERRDTERPTSRSGAIVELCEGIDTLATHFELNLGRITREMEQLNKRINEIPDEVRAASREGAANAVIDLVTRLEVLEDWKRKRDAACHGCPRLDTAAGQ